MVELGSLSLEAGSLFAAGGLVAVVAGRRQDWHLSVEVAVQAETE